jgi:hypothetical protein
MRVTPCGMTAMRVIFQPSITVGPALYMYMPVSCEHAQW